MTNTELTLARLRAISGGNCTDTEKKELKKTEFNRSYDELFFCTEDDDPANNSAKESRTKKS